MAARNRRVIPGIDHFLESGIDRLRGTRFALLAHAASCASDLTHIFDRLSADSGVKLVRVFGPEHGFRGEAQDMEGVGESTERGVPVTSLYGAGESSLAPPPVSLEGVDVLVCDLQDVGSRYYTFVYTMAFCMAACAKTGVRVIVLDRPNPIGGLAVEGPILQTGYESFVGRYPIPVRHGMTIGELAGFFNERFGIGCELSIVPMEGWRREMHWADTGLPWVSPSPNMPTPETTLVYPGLCLLEGTNLSEGRGTTRPFELFGAPWLNPSALADDLNALELPGARFRPCRFKPTFQKHAGVVCDGAQIHVTDPAAFRPFRTGVEVIAAARRQSPADFAWRDTEYEFVTDRPAIDLLTGSDRVRAVIDGGGDVRDLEAAWNADEAAFVEERKPYLLYR